MTQVIELATIALPATKRPLLGFAEGRWGEAQAGNFSLGLS